MAEGKTERFQVLVLDDYEGIAALVPAFGKLPARADITISEGS
ncbi:MAG: hypothetical protein AABZ59_07825 [Candidatus Binatota bacterium]